MRTAFFSLLCLALGACGGTTAGDKEGPSPTGDAGVAQDSGTEPTPPPSCSPNCTPTKVGSLSSTVGGVVALVVDDTNVYAADESGDILAVPIAGGNVTTLATIAAGYNNGLSLALEGDDVYFGGGGEVGSVPKAGGTVTTLSSGETETIGLLATSSSLYWEEGYTAGESGATGVLHGLGFGSTKVSNLVEGLSVLYATATDGESLYWSTLGGIYKVALTGGTPTVLYNQSTVNLSADGESLYWSVAEAEVSCGLCGPPVAPTATSSTIFRLSTSGGAPTTLVQGYSIGNLAVLDGVVYYADSYKNTLSQVFTTGGTATVIASSATVSLGPVVGASDIFWVDANKDIQRVAR